MSRSRAAREQTQRERSAGTLAARAIAWLNDGDDGPGLSGEAATRLVLKHRELVRRAEALQERDAVALARHILRAEDAVVFARFIGPTGPEAA